MHDFLTFLALSGNTFSFFNKVELIAFFAGLDDVFTSLESFLNKGVREDRALIRLHAFKDFDLSKEVFILFSLPLRSVLNDVVESLAIKGPQKCVIICFDCSGTRGVI